MANGEEKNGPQAIGYQGSGAVWGGDTDLYAQKEKAALAGVQSGYDTAAAAGAVPGVIAEAGRRRVGEIRAQHKSALALARQSLASEANRALRRRSSGGSLQAAGTLGKTAAATYGSMASQAASDVGAAEADARERAASAEVVAKREAEEAQTGEQSYILDQISQQGEGEALWRQNAEDWSAEVFNSYDLADTLEIGFTNAYNTASIYLRDLEGMQGFPPAVNAAVSVLSEVLMASPNQTSTETKTYVSQRMPAMIEKLGFMGTLNMLKWMTTHVTGGWGEWKTAIDEKLGIAPPPDQTTGL